MSPEAYAQYAKVGELLASNAGLKDGMKAICCWCSEGEPHAVWKTLESMDWESEVEEFPLWLSHVLKQNPLPAAVKTLLIELVELTDLDDKKCPVTLGLRIVGGTDEPDGDIFPPDDGDEEFPYEPPSLTAGSTNLVKIQKTFSSLTGAGRGGASDEVKSLGTYVLPLAYAGLLLNRVLPKLPPSKFISPKTAVRHIALGFSGGDCLVLGKVNKEGFTKLTSN